MNKIGIILIIITSMFQVAYPVYADTNPNILNLKSQQVKVGSNYYTLNDGTINIKGKLYVPFREFSNILGFPVTWDEKNEIGEINPNLKKVDLITSDNNVLYNEAIVPNETVAYELGKIVLENLLGKPVVFEEDDLKSDLKVSFVGGDENYWNVYQVLSYKEVKYRVVNLTNCVHINKNTGEIKKIVLTLPDYDEIKIHFITQYN